MYIYITSQGTIWFREIKIFMAEVQIEESWKAVLSTEFSKPYFENLIQFVKKEYQATTVYPSGKDIFKAFDHCSFEKVKVVIIGQDPYHGPGQANGLCFSVKEGIKHPPSLVNIFKELQDDLGKEYPQSGSLEKWADQGVLLLNATLTVRAREAGSHQGKGWEEFTSAVIEKVSALKEGVVFVLWGAYAQKKGAIIDQSKHFTIESAHPSPFSVHRGFFGSKPFSKTNEYLISKGKKSIEW